MTNVTTRLLMLNGALVPVTDAVVPAVDRGFTQGLGLYETIKLIDGLPVFFDEHVLRLDRGIEALGLERPFNAEGLAGQIVELAKANGVTEAACRLLVTAGPPDAAPTLLIQNDTRAFPARPLSVITYRGVRVSAEFKAMTVMQSFLALKAAAAAGVDDAILVDGEGRIFEGATSNVFVVRRGGLVTAPAEGDILPGVTRAKLESIAGEAGIPVIEAWVRVADLRPDDGMLLTSSVRGVVPVSRVNALKLHPSDGLVRRLRELVEEAEAVSVEAFRAAYL